MRDFQQHALEIMQRAQEVSLIYLTEAPTRFGVFPAGARLVGLWQLLTGIWLMYLTYPVCWQPLQS